ncbi:KH domain-containing protein [Metabacillus sp. GX 13764]|uniref:KH domain-containing protein n=1 Tax=Metabacillus kandeliae TaxID=2900151 RepID=UPI001E57088D|nr:KH domain-containing protein [Metabacillus kandeliae]
MQQLIETIVRALVDFPEDVKVTAEDRDHQIAYQLTVNKTDIGKVIGKQGRVAKAIRTVVYAAGSQSSKRILLEIND